MQSEPAGELLVLAEADYLYGAGTLILRVKEIDRIRPIEYDGQHWFAVRGTEIAANGRDLGDRETLVRGRRLFK